ncbi:hypothetical protein D3C85_1548600 [compost metagenome]
MLGHALDEVGLFGFVRQFTVQQQVTGFEVVAVLCELLDGVAAVQQLALVAVDVRDCRLAGCRREEAGVIREHAGLAVQLANINHVRANVALVHGQFDAGAAIRERQCCFVIGEFHFQLPSLVCLAYM